MLVNYRDTLKLIQVQKIPINKWSTFHQAIHHSKSNHYSTPKIFTILKNSIRIKIKVYSLKILMIFLILIKIKMSQEIIKNQTNKINEKISWYKLNIISKLIRKKDKYQRVYNLMKKKKLITLGISG